MERFSFENWFVYLFGSGVAFFLGIAMILAALVLFLRWQQRWKKIVATLLVLTALIFIAMSSIPLPYWLYAIAGASTFLWLVAERFPRGWLLRRRNLLRGLMLAAWTTAVALELPYHLGSSLHPLGNPKLYIIGDSVAAGIGGQDEVTWPQLLAKSRPVEVVDFSRSGATARSALKQTDGLPPDGGLVLLEIGGNDMLGVGTSTSFEHDLGQLLSKVCQPQRTVMMFELPLPPFYNDFGRVQRRLASEYGVVLIPRRIFVAVLTKEGTTLDSVHLTAAGHERMAEVVWELIAGAYGQD